jgi:CheY-like chemotaxis protein
MPDHATSLTLDSHPTDVPVDEAAAADTAGLAGLGPLAAGVAADLSGLLGPVLMASSLLSEHMRGEHAAAVGMLEHAARRGEGLMRQILALSGGHEVRPPLVHPTRLLEEVRRLVAETFPRAIDVVVEAGADAMVVRGEPMELGHVLMTFCLDARQAMPAGGRLTLRSETLPAPTPGAEPRIVLSVSGTGTGAGPAIDPHTPARETADAIVRAHGGVITVDQTAGRGSTVRIELPSASVLPPEHAARPPAPPRGRDELVLVVGDQASVRTLTEHVLRAAGYRVAVAASGAEAVTLCARHGHDVGVVLLDMTPPAPDGANTIRALRTIDPGVRIVAAAASAGGGPALAPLAPDVAAFLVKPYTATALLEIMRTTLGD